MLSIGNDDESHIFKDCVILSENLWCHKFWMVFNKQTKNIEMYEVKTMKLYHILPFGYFEVTNIKWNQEQSSFIAYSRYDGRYCVFKRV